MRASLIRGEDKFAVVTGAGRPGSIGEAIALRLSSEGRALAVVDLCQERPKVPRERFSAWESLLGVAERLQAFGVKAIPVKADLTREEDVMELMAAADETFGRIDALFNNAGAGTGAGPVETTPVAELEMKDWRYTFAISIDSDIHCSKHASPIIARAGGAIVSTVSISARHGAPGLSAYPAANYGSIALTRTLAVELASNQIRVNAFSPGMTATPYVKQRFDTVAAEKPELSIGQHMTRLVADRIPLERPAQPSVAAFLASHDASYMTGQTLQIDGGKRV